MPMMTDEENGVRADGNYAIIRRYSDSGHSPSHRFNSEKSATAAAVAMCEQNPNLELQVVRILKTVTSKPMVRIIRARK